MSEAVSRSMLSDSELPAGNVEITSLGRTALRRLFRQRNSIAGAIILGILVFVAIFAPVIAPFDPINDLIDEEGIPKRTPPCIHLLGCPESEPQHILGVDGNVRDLFSRILFGARISLSIGFVTIFFAVLIGTLLGAVAGYFGGWLDIVIMRIMDVVLAFPTLLLAIAIVAVLGPGLRNAMLAIAIVRIPAFARIMRASVLQIKEQDYVEASVALGAGHFHILTQRIIPNALTPLIVQGTLDIGGAILDTAGLSFIGFGAQPPIPEWGAMLGSERNQIFSAPHLVFFPGLAIMITVLAFNLLGDGLRDALDPRLAKTDLGAAMREAATE